MDISKLVEIEHTYSNSYGQYVRTEKYYNFKEFYEQLIEGFNNIVFENDITKFKTYYCSGLSIPKDRIKRIEDKYGLKKVRDCNKADVIFTEEYFIKNIYDSIIGKFNILSITKKENNGTSYTRYPFGSDDIIKPFGKYDLNTSCITKAMGDRIIDRFSFYISGKPLICVSDICEEDLPILTRSNFITNYLDRLQSTNTFNLSVLSLYSQYNAISIRAIIRSFYINNTVISNSRKFLSVDYNIKRVVANNIHYNKNNDVYSRYILANSNKIITKNSDILTHYFFTLFNKKYIDEAPYSAGWYYFKKNVFLKDTLDKLKLGLLLQCKFFSFNMENLSTTNKPEGYVILSSDEALQKIESELINFKALPEKDKDRLVDVLLDMLGNLVKVDNIRS